ncbi:MAG: murein L,D-transpeptidase family protein [Alphaproteobacteria bacterium]
MANPSPRLYRLGLALVLATAGLSGCVQREPIVVPSVQVPLVKPPARTVDRVLVFKERRRLYLMSRDTIVETMPIALGGNPVGPKHEEGDKRTPEGVYLLDWRNANSRFYKSLHISYPNAQDVERAHAAGVQPGGNVMIHGLPNGMGWYGETHALNDWTDGCIAVTNEQMDMIWRLVDDNTPIEVRP